jgi:hypothetical protein
MDVATTTERHPLDGRGAVTATAASSAVYDTGLNVIEGFIVLVYDASSNLVITDGSGNTIDTFMASAAFQNTLRGKFNPLGVEGIEIRGPFGAKLSGGAGGIQLFYRKVM